MSKVIRLTEDLNDGCQSEIEIQPFTDDTGEFVMVGAQTRKGERWIGTREDVCVPVDALDDVIQSMIEMRDYIQVQRERYR